MNLSDIRRNITRPLLTGGAGILLAWFPFAARIPQGSLLFVPPSSALVWLSFYSFLQASPRLTCLIRVILSLSLYLSLGFLLYLSLLWGFWPGVTPPPLPVDASGLVLFGVVLLGWPMFLTFLLHGGPE
jgi:hypothetical protein